MRNDKFLIILLIIFIFVFVGELSYYLFLGKNETSINNNSNIEINKKQKIQNINFGNLVTKSVGVLNLNIAELDKINTKKKYEGIVILKTDNGQSFKYLYGYVSEVNRQYLGVDFGQGNIKINAKDILFIEELKSFVSMGDIEEIKKNTKKITIDNLHNNDYVRIVEVFSEGKFRGYAVHKLEK